MDAGDPKLNDTSEYTAVPALEPWRVRVEPAGRTEVGKVRGNNEDHFLISRIRRVVEVVETNLDGGFVPPMREESGHGFVVADGMGGMASGEEASRLAIVTGLELVRDAGRWHLDLDDPSEVNDLHEALLRYFRRVNRRVYREASMHSSLEGMGTTLTAAYSVGLRLFVIHVGDSRAYLHHGELLQQITRDHTVAQDLARSGQISQEQVRTHRLRNVLTNYIGSASDGIEAEIHSLELADGDRLLLCSDGLTDLVDDARIAEILTRSAGPEAACDALIEAALGAGGRDNVTVVVADYRIEQDA